MHENHVYIDVYETYPSAEHQRAGLHGTVSKVQIRCMHSGVDYPSCSVPIDVTAVAKGWAVSCQQADIWNKHVSYIENTASFMYQTEDHHPVPVQHASSIANTMANRVSMTVKEWLAHSKRRSYYEVDFFPSLGEEHDQRLRARA